MDALEKGRRKEGRKEKKRKEKKERPALGIEGGRERRGGD